MSRAEVTGQGQGRELTEMTFSWRFETADGTPVSPASAGSDSFPNKADAETWVGEAWPDLVADGIYQVTLLEGDRVVYGPMSLHPPT